MPAARDTKNSKATETEPANGNGNGNGDGPRRSSLVQERSRRTRQELVNAAVKLWTERGFEHGVENTTVEEIARAAGVTKGTFYFHFAHKEDVLLEMSLTTSDAVNDVAKRAAAEGDTIDDIILKSFNEMARRTERLPRAAIKRTVREFYKYPTRARELSMTRRVFPALFADAQARGELPREVDPEDLSDMFNALMITAIEGWVHGAHEALAPELAYRTRVVFAGVRAVHGS
jgi:AcrR family transcriptional regulator